MKEFIQQMVAKEASFFKIRKYISIKDITNITAKMFPSNTSFENAHNFLTMYNARRELQKNAGQTPQSVLTMPILEGLDGVQKMSKSLNNYIGIKDSAKDIFGKTMSISDDLMWRYYELLSDLSIKEIKVLQAGHPMAAKKQLAQELTARFYDEETARQERSGFEAQFKCKEIPDDIPEVDVSAEENGTVGIAHAMLAAGMVKSNGDGMRMIKQSAVSIDGEKISDTKQTLTTGERVLLKVGKRKFSYVKII